MRRSRIVHVCAAALLAVGAGPLRAEEQREEQSTPEPAAEERPRLPEPEYVEVNLSDVPTSNTIAAKLPLPLQLTPANVGVVSGPLLREQHALVLSDALRNVSSVQAQPNAGVHDFFLVRGFDSLSGGMVLTDGAVEPEATNYPLYNVEGVEVLKGPSGFLYGSDPLAGVVNLVRKQPLPTDFLRVGASMASFGTAEATLDWNLAGEEAQRSFRLNGLFFESDNYRDDKESRQLGVNPGVALRVGEKGTLNFNLEYVDAEYAPDAGIPLVQGELPEVPRRRSYQTPFDFSDQQLRRFQADYELKRSEAFTLRNKLYYRGLDWDTRGTQLAGVFPDGAGSLLVSRFQTTLDDEQRVLGDQFEALLDLGQGRVRHGLLLGLEARRLSDEFDIGFVPPENPQTPGVPGIPALDLFDPVETATQLDPFPFLIGESDSTVIAPYVVDQLQVGAELRFLVGARYDFISRDDQRTATNPPLSEELSRDDGDVSPMLGALWAPTDRLSLYANASESFAPAGVRVFGELDPEESRGYEVGVKQRFLEDALRTTVALYQLDRENVAIPDDNGVTQQAGDQRSRGVELDLALELPAGFRAFLAYAYTDAELVRFRERVIVGFDPDTGQPIEATLDRSGNTPAFVPRNLASLWVSQGFSGGWGLGGGLRWFSDQFVAEDNAAEIDGAVVFDASAYYDFKACRVTLNLKNVTDVEYERRGFGSTSVTPADPFAVIAGFEIRL